MLKLDNWIENLNLNYKAATVSKRPKIITDNIKSFNSNHFSIPKNKILLVAI